MGPHVITRYKNLASEKEQDDGYYALLLGYPQYTFRDFESYFGSVVGWGEDDFQPILKQYNSHFITYEVILGISSIKDHSESVYTMGYHEIHCKLKC